jgi:hypothetical protein
MTLTAPVIATPADEESTRPVAPGPAEGAKRRRGRSRGGGKASLTRHPYAGRVKDVLILAAPALMLAMLYCCWRALNLFRTWTPAVATVWQSDYTDAERSDDFWHFGVTLGTLRGWNWRDGENGRLIEDEVMFTDAEGKSRRATVERRVRRGWRPSSVYTIWYDPADPNQVTAVGPGYWLMMMAVFATMLVGVFSLCLQLGKV